MTPGDRALLAEIAERAAAYHRWLKEDGPNPDDLWQAVDDRVDLLRIVGQLEHLLRERDTLAEDRADDAAAERATAGRWGAG